MKKNMRKAFKAMQKIGAPVLDREHDGNFILSAEDNDTRIWADYWGEFHGGYSHIDPELEQIAQDNGLFIEWENPGSLTIYPV